MRTSNFFLIILILLLTMMAGLTTGFAVASNVPVASGVNQQPFARPSDDVSYDEDVREDEALLHAKPVNNGKVRYISGGIAEGGMRAMDREASAYDLKLLFVAEGEYLANVTVNITDDKGNNMLNVTAEGPVLLAQMPPGRYMLVARNDDGDTLRRRLQVNNDHLASYVLRYPNHE